MDLKQTQGWQIMEQWLKDRAHHSWVDPRGIKQEDWQWAELNAFHSADVAISIMKSVDDAIATAEYLIKKEKGEIDDNVFKRYWSKVQNLTGDKNDSNQN